MPYVTHIDSAYRQLHGQRMTHQDLIRAQFSSPFKSLHSKNFNRTKTFYTNDPRPYTDNTLNRAEESIIAICHEDFPRLYTTFNIPKATGGVRRIEAPTGQLKYAQRRIADIITQDLRVLCHDAAYAYTMGRCAYDALVTHQRADAKWFLKIDLKDFFPSCTQAMVIRSLADIYPISNFSQQTHELIAEIAVNDRGVLPQGSPISPLISNLIMLPFDKTLTQKIRRFNHQSYTYTRYADDLLITSPFDFKYEDVLQLVEDTLSKHALPFTINRAKLRYASMSGRNWNLGLMYNKDQNITIGQKKKKELHSLVNAFMKDFTTVISTESEWSKQSTQELIGKLGYLKNVEPDYYQTIITKYSRMYDHPVTEAFAFWLNNY